MHEKGLTMSPINPSSGFGCDKSTRIVVKSVDRLIEGLHDPCGGDLSVSKQIRPLVSMLGWYTGVINRTRGGSNG